MTRTAIYYNVLSCAPVIVIYNSQLTNLLLGFLVLLMGGILVYFRLHHESSRKEEMEQFRQQVARDFHDELGSRLSIITMYSELIKSRIGKDDATMNHYLEKIVLASNDLYGSMKDLLWTLKPGHDSLHDLLLKVKDFGEELFSESDMNFHAEGMGDVNGKVLLPIEHRRHILLIFKEAMNNALRHSGASNITFEIRRSDKDLEICLTDDGRGFDPEKVKRGEGLNNMRSRAQKIGGDCILQSMPGRTRVALHLPGRNSTTHAN